MNYKPLTKARIEQITAFVIGLMVAPLLNIPGVYGQTALRDSSVTVTGNASVGGALSKSSGTFVIDHPLDPANKLLFHSFVESPDVKNIYDGIAILDSAGEAVIQLPDYFEVLNIEYRYLYSPVDEPMPGLHIKEKIVNNRFVIGGGSPNGKVNWQVTGIRNDPFIVANPIINEVEKGPEALVDKGVFLFAGYAELLGIGSTTNEQ